MNGRERLLNTFAGKPTDRVPVSPFIYNNVVNERNGGEPTDPIAACIEYYKSYGFDILLRNYIPGLYLDESQLNCDTWRVESVTTGNPDQAWDVKTTITTPERTMTQVTAFRRVSKFEVVTADTECYIKSPEDLEQFKKYQPPVPQYDCSSVTYARKMVGDDGLTGPWVNGVFNMCGTYRRLSDLLTDPYEDEEFFHDQMEYFYNRVSKYVVQVLDAGADFISMAGNMASGSMAGPAMFRTYIMPYEMRLINLIHQHGGKVIYHNCGDAKYLLPCYNEMGIDMYESLTAPPYGDTVLEYALEVMQPPMVLSGNLDQIHFLKTASPDEIREEVKAVMETVKKRGYFIFACSDYLCEGTPEENLKAFAEAAFEYGSYQQ